MILTNIILFFILVCLYFISNIIWEIYSNKNGDKIDDKGFFQNFFVSVLYVLVFITIIYFIVNYIIKLN
jgi:uncharacterized membrane protein YphA (DoxX/SURF4 family)